MGKRESRREGRGTTGKQAGERGKEATVKEDVIKVGGGGR